VKIEGKTGRDNGSGSSSVKRVRSGQKEKRSRVDSLVKIGGEHIRRRGGKSQSENVGRQMGGGALKWDIPIRSKRRGVTI